MVLPSTDLIGWSHQTTAAVSCGMKINVVPDDVRFCEIVDILLLWRLLLVLFSARKESVSEYAQCVQ